MLLSDEDIRHEMSTGGLGIAPLGSGAIQPASVDIRLGNVFMSYPRHSSVAVIDPACPMPMMRTETLKHYMLLPREFILGVSVEKIAIGNRLAARIEGKSSLGRLGLMVHSTAGFIDPGFTGYLTLEMTNLAPYPIKLYAGMWIAQVGFHLLKSACLEPYGERRGSRYTDAGKVSEPTSSRVETNLGLVKRAKEGQD